jgi:glycine/D-amino acid oxidase-like deaminating enzyme
MLPETISVLGGGITGLSSAFHLSRRFPSAHIFLLDKQNGLEGGYNLNAFSCLTVLGLCCLKEDRELYDLMGSPFLNW